MILLAEGAVYRKKQQEISHVIGKLYLVCWDQKENVGE